MKIIFFYASIFLLVFQACSNQQKEKIEGVIIHQYVGSSDEQHLTVKIMILKIFCYVFLSIFVFVENREEYSVQLFKS